MKNFFIIFFLLISSIYFGCSSSSVKQTAPPPSLKPLVFDFTPPSGSMTPSYDINFALLNPVFVETFRESNVDPFKTFAVDMGNDFVEMLTARGFKYKGPFLNNDQMVYSDKKESDLTLLPIIDLQLTGNYLKQGKYFDVLRTSWIEDYYYDGEVTVTGKLNLEFAEPFTKTKIWVKSIQIEPVTFKIKSYTSYTTPNIPLDDPLVWNSLVDNLQAIYNKALQTAWNHLEPEELLQKKSEADEIKKNSNYVK